MRYTLTGMVKCESCEEARQKENNTPVVAGHVHPKCKVVYNLVEQCMVQHKGRVSPCQKEWADFQNCHLKTREERLQ